MAAVNLFVGCILLFLIPQIAAMTFDDWLSLRARVFAAFATVAASVLSVWNFYEGLTA